MTIPLSLLAVHWLGDFVLQNDWMALNKSKDWRALFVHCCVYTFGVGLWGVIVNFPTEMYGNLIVVTFATHFVTDWVTSRITSRLWFLKFISPTANPDYNVFKSAGSRHWFFVTIGFDQLIHYTTLALTLRYLS